MSDSNCDIDRRTWLKLGMAGVVSGLLPMPSYSESRQSTAKIVVVGVGAAGLAVANRLTRELPNARITVIGKQASHFYQPGFTLVASGLWDACKVETSTKEWLPPSVHWLQQDVAEFDPDHNRLFLENRVPVDYDLLVIATGCQLNYGEIEGMAPELIGQHGIGSVYAGPQAAAATNEMVSSLIAKGAGRAIFTLCHTPLKCAGAPIKFAFTSLSRVMDETNRKNYQFDFFSPYPQTVFAVPAYNDFVLQRWQQQDVKTHFSHKLVAIAPEHKRAVFATPDGQHEEYYDFIHVVPPMSAPDVVRNSPLAWQSGKFSGWLEVDQYSLQHRRYANVFGIGDVIGTPFGKTAASVKLQAPVVEANLLAYLEERPLPAAYNGYTSCPLITAVGTAILAEFGYEGKLLPSFPFIDPLEESWLVWVMKEKMLQPAYYAMLNGRV
ncbi:MAG: NAD(P)/FAD-dependent oxidoreductase [Gammaproteobacteria bacterium]|nr:NAD(P)/FAD-dependent oxidoreductase [Gammaproteobacteria bacterium]